MYFLIAGITYFVVKKAMEDGYLEQDLNFRWMESSMLALMWPLTTPLLYWRFQKLIELAQEVNQLAEDIDSSVPDIQHIEKLTRQVKEEQQLKEL